VLAVVLGVESGEQVVTEVMRRRLIRSAAGELTSVE
jgi:hypothetical protein